MDRVAWGHKRRALSAPDISPNSSHTHCDAGWYNGYQTRAGGLRKHCIENMKDNVLFHVKTFITSLHKYSINLQWLSFSCPFLSDMSDLGKYRQNISTQCLIVPFIYQYISGALFKYCSPLTLIWALDPQVVRHDGPSGSSQRPIVLDDTANSDVEISDDDYQGEKFEFNSLETARLSLRCPRADGWRWLSSGPALTVGNIQWKFWEVYD